MIVFEPSTNNFVKVTISGTLKETDFRTLNEQANSFLRARGSLRLLIDATNFSGWASMSAAESHFAFVRDHHRKIDRVAIITGHEWQHWLAGIARVFIHPDVKVFEPNETLAAQSWLREKEKMAA